MLVSAWKNLVTNLTRSFNWEDQPALLTDGSTRIIKRDILSELQPGDLIQLAICTWREQMFLVKCRIKTIQGEQIIAVADCKCFPGEYTVRLNDITAVYPQRGLNLIYTGQKREYIEELRHFCLRSEDDSA